MTTDTAQRAKVFEYYNAGYTQKEIERATGYEYDYIDDLVWRWKVMEAREKKRIKAEIEPPRLRMPEKEGVHPFVLITKDPKVIAAYLKMTNP